MSLAVARPRRAARSALVLVRPAQWSKNLLVLAAPLAAGRLGEGPVLWNAVRAFAAFSLAASAVYCVNDVLDAEADRHHPRKRERPVASGELTPGAALAVAGVCAAGAFAVCSTAALALVLASYVLVSLGYSLGLKRQAVVELCLVASGFLLRAVGGGPASGVPLSRWFLIVTGFGSLFVVAGKRLAELVEAGDPGPRSRPILAQYTPSYLRMIVAVSAGVTMTGYSLWAFDVGDAHGGFPWAALSIVPMVVAALRYTLEIDAGRAQEPEQIVLRDRALQLLALCWLVCFVLAVSRG